MLCYVMLCYVNACVCVTVFMHYCVFGMRVRGQVRVCSCMRVPAWKLRILLYRSFSENMKHHELHVHRMCSQALVSCATVPLI